MKFIVTAGGQGTKVWPMSRESKPKQFQNLVGEKTLYRSQIDTLLKGYSVEDIYISTKHKYLHFIEDLSPEIPKENIIIEPDFKKNRGPGEGYAFLKLNEIFPSEPFMIVQSDVIRQPEEKFLEMIAEAEKLVRKDGKFITAGQKAIHADMGSDYIRLKEKINDTGNVEVYEVETFVERLGDYQKTKDLIENYHVSTHCNHSCWTPSLMLNAYKEYRPDWYDALMQIKQTFGQENEVEETARIYSEMEEGSTEEVTKHVMQDGYVILTPFKWIDIGTWGSIYDNLAKYGENYVDSNEVVMIDTKESLVKSNGGKLIATLGVEDLVIVNTEDALLVTTRENAGRVKEILKNLKESGRDQFL